MNWILTRLNFLVWLLIRPSKWRQHLEIIDPTLDVNFALIDLTPRHWKKPSVQLLLLSGYLVNPCLILGFFISIAVLFGLQVTGSLYGIFFVYLLALFTGIYASVPASLLLIPLAGSIAIFQWSGPAALVFDVTTTTRLGVLLSMCSACMLIAAALHSQNRKEQTIVRQIGAITLGLLISIPIVIFVTYSVFVTTAGRQSGTLGGAMMVWATTLPTVIIFAAATYVRTKSIAKVIFSIAFCATLISSGYGDMGYEYDRGTGGFHLLTASMTIICSTYCMLSIFPYILTRSFVGDWPATVAATIGGSSIYYALQTSFTYFPLLPNLAIAVTIVLLALGYRYTWSLFAYPFEAAWNKILTELDNRHQGPLKYFKRHAACWDEIQCLEFFELDDYLISASTRNSDNGAACRALIGYTNQQWAAQSATLELDARHRESLPDINALAQMSDDGSAGLLDTSAGLVLRSFARSGRDIQAALAQPTIYNQSLVLRTAAKDLENLQMELSRNYKDRTSARFVSVANHWHSIVQQHIAHLEQQSKTSHEIPNPYIVGVPLTRKQSIFVGRTDTARYLEGILKVQDHPPLLLYGPRRMGKTSLLYQLHWMLPRHILPLIVDLQGPVSLATDDTGFVYALARGMRQAAEKQDVRLPILSRQQLSTEPYMAFDEWLNVVESIITQQGRSTLLLAMDEFEALDTALAERTLRHHAILGMFRHMAQHRRNIKLMLVGSHTLGEFRRWSSYFVNAQVIELSYLTSSDINQLITQPIADFPLAYHSDAISRMIRLTRGHPYLLQLACTEVIAYKNTQPIAARQVTTVGDIESIIPLMLERGQQFFTDIELNQIDKTGRGCLLQLASEPIGSSTRLALEKSIPALKENDTLARLEQRKLIEIIDDRFGFQIEAVRHWFSVNNRHR